MISDLTQCDIRNCKDLVILKHNGKGKTVVLYSEKGGHPAMVYNKHCSSCKSIVTPCYTDFDGVRRYHEGMKRISVTAETFFDVTYLNVVTEDLFTSSCRFDDITARYNRINNKGIEMNKKRLQSAWFMFSIVKRLGGVKIPIIRDKTHGIDMEKICEGLYPELRKFIDLKWREHQCTECSSRTIVMDGAQKLYRSRCAAQPEKILRVGNLNEFIACSAAPLPGKKFCINHVNDKYGKSAVRLDSGVVTRSQELGFEEDILTTGGCRKKDKIAIREDRQRTAGMLYAIRPCGIVMGHMELVHAETCTAFVLLLIELFGETPQPSLLTGVLIDRACDVHPYVKRIGEEGSKVCQYFATKLKWAVDRFHIKGHHEEKGSHHKKI